MARDVTTRSFSTMLNEYLPNDLMREELIKRDWFLTNVKKDDSWMGGSVIVPFEGAPATSLSFSSLTAANDISEFAYVRGSITEYQEVWGSLIFNHADLMQHGKISEQNFLKVLPNQIDQFINYFKEVVSINLLCGPHFAKMMADSDLANGICEVDKIDRFYLGQKVTLDDDNSNEGDYYVIAINVNLSRVTLSASRGGAAANISAYTTAQNGKFYHPGMFKSNAVNNYFQSVRDALLSYSNSSPDQGGQYLHGTAKLSYPFLQAVNIDGSSITASNIIEKIFDAYTTFRSKAKAANANKVVMSYKHLGSIMKLIEITKGQNNYRVGSTKVNMYGWTEIEITSVKGSLILVGIQEMDDRYIFFLDMSSMCFRSNGMFRKRKSPDGTEYFETRATTGYSYIVDVCLFGQLEVTAPARNAVIYGISYS